MPYDSGFTIAGQIKEVITKSTHNEKIYAQKFIINDVKSEESENTRY